MPVRMKRVQRVFYAAIMGRKRPLAASVDFGLGLLVCYRTLGQFCGPDRVCGRLIALIAKEICIS